MQYYLYLLLLVSLACPSRGATIFSDFDPANIAYQGGWGIYGTGNSLSPGAFKAQAMAFTPPSMQCSARSMLRCFGVQVRTQSS